jgi:flagellar hook-length control protein FliK
LQTPPIAYHSPKQTPITIRLQFPPTGVIDVVIAETPPKEITMITITEETTAQAPAEKPKAAKKASIGQKRAHVAPAKGKAAKKAKAPKKAPKGAKKAGAALGGRIRL